jgi:mono/diheme cytochrome c family protein
VTNRALAVSLVSFWSLVGIGPVEPAAGVQDTISFARDIQPILQGVCQRCHGEQQESGLDLRTRDGALKGGKHGPAMVPGRADQSRMYRRVAGLEQPSMPRNGTLTSQQIAAIRAWIDQGAHWDAPDATASAQSPRAGARGALEDMEIPAAARSYWAFKLPAAVPVPDVSDPFRNPIDRFLEAARRDRGLEAAPRADRLTLLRRACLDLVGLPPTPAETASFISDTSPGAWPRLIDRLLASPHYGERWGRHWLDVARYADSSGFEHDYDRPNAWRYRDYVIRSFNQDKAYDVFLKEQIAGDELDEKSDEAMIATGFLRAGPRVAYREKDNPERRYDYLDDVIATIGKGVLGLTVQCARCHNHKFDPIPQKDYYSLVATLFGYVETTYPLAPHAEVEAYERALSDINAQQASLRAEIRKIEAPHEDDLRREAYKRFPPNVQQAIAKPERDRTPGEQLLARQVIDQVNVGDRAFDHVLTPEERVGRDALTARIASLEKQKPTPVPVAEIVTDGDYRFAPDGNGDEVVGCPKCRLTDAPSGSFLHTGPGRYETPPSYFLIRGDPAARGSLMRPGFVSVATYGAPPTEIPPADGHTSGRRRALAEWLASPQNPLTARVIVNRIWHHHFGRGIVATLDNLGRMGDQPTHRELLDYLAVAFMTHGWSIKQMHRLIMTSDAYQMASAYDDAVDREKDPQNQYLWRFRAQRLDAEVVRDSILSASGGINLAMGGPPVFPPLSQELLASASYGIWKRQEDGPAVWRRSVYVYRRRGLVFPMFEVFDLPDQSGTAGARSVSTVPTQALMLLNDPFVLRQARMFADRVRQEAGGDPARQVDLAYRIALTRPPTTAELHAAVEFLNTQPLVDLAHVLFNLNEFVYSR